MRGGVSNTSVRVYVYTAVDAYTAVSVCGASVPCARECVFCYAARGRIRFSIRVKRGSFFVAKVCTVASLSR